MKTRTQRLATSCNPLPVHSLNCLTDRTHVALPCRGGAPTNLLSLALGICRFVPRSYTRVTSPPVLLDRRLRVKRHCRVLLAAPNNLCHCRVGSIIRIAKFCRQSPLITFLHGNHSVDGLAKRGLRIGRILTTVTTLRGRFRRPINPCQLITGTRTVHCRLC